MISTELKAYVAVMMIQGGFAGMFLLSKASLASGTKPSVFITYRQAFATLFLTPFAFFFKSRESNSPLTCRALCKIFIVSSCGFALSLNLNYEGLNHISATVGSALYNTLPPVVFIMALCLRIETLEIRQWHGMAKVMGTLISLCGAMAFTFYKGPPIFSTSTHHNFHEKRSHTKQEWIMGCFLCFASQIAFSLWLTTQGSLLKQYPGKLRLVNLQCAFSCVVSCVYGAAMERNISSWKLHWNMSLLSIAYCGIVVTGIGYWLQAWVVEKKGPVFCAAFGPLALIFSAIFSAIFLGEILHWGSVLGGVVLVGGLYCFLWGKNREAQQKMDTSNEEAQQKLDTSNGEAHLQTIITSPPSNSGTLQTY